MPTRSRAPGGPAETPSDAQLAPCPFCGGEAMLQSNGVACTVCFASTVRQRGMKPSRHRAAWNRRAKGAQNSPSVRGDLIAVLHDIARHADIIRENVDMGVADATAAIIGDAARAAITEAGG